MAVQTREKLLAEATEALRKARNPRGVTVRDIAYAADANPALVNYYFGSKEGLVEEAVRRIAVDGMTEAVCLATGKSAVQLLEDVALHFVRGGVEFFAKSKLAVPTLTREDLYQIAGTIAPLVRECEGPEVPEREARLAAYQLASTLSSLAFDPEGCCRFCEIGMGRPDIDALALSATALVTGVYRE